MTTLRGAATGRVAASGRAALVGRDASVGRVATTATLSSVLDVAAIRAGAVFDPAVGVTLIGTGPNYYTWEAVPGCAANAEGAKFTTLVDGSFNPPQPVTTAGKTVWTFTEAESGPQGGALVMNGTFASTSPGASMRWAREGVILFWADLASEDASQRYLVEMWPGDGVSNRLFIYKDTVVGKLIINVSPLGIGDDDTPDRTKLNYEFDLALDFTQPHNYAFFFNYNLTASVAGTGGDAGSYYTYVIELYVDGVRRWGGTLGYVSAPPDHSLGVIGGGIYTGPTRLCFGGNSVSSPWRGTLGTFILANGLFSPALLPQIMALTSPV